MLDFSYLAYVLRTGGSGARLVRTFDEHREVRSVELVLLNQSRSELRDWYRAEALSD